jgi:flagellar biosynthesis protein FlhF
MELKRILARDSRSANEKAIQLYGKDVLIISSQRHDNQTELIVAVELDTSPAPREVEQANVALPRPHEAEPFVPFSKLFQSASAFAPLSTDAPALPLTPAGASTALALPESAPEPVSVPAIAHGKEVVAAVTQVKPAAPAMPNPLELAQLQHEGQRSHEIVALLRQEMEALRKEFSLSRQMMPWQDGLRLSPAIQQLTLAMSEAGVPAGLRGLLTDSIQTLASVEEALPVMHGLLVNALKRQATPLPATGVHAFCGPSGAGKTSMVGRLAFAAAQSHGSDQQAMVSFADQRPGAWAQMQLLAAQSGVACYRAGNSDMLRALLDDLEGKTVWIDTSGTDFLAQAELLFAHHPKVLRHAVLPLDATVTSVQKILQNQQLTWTSLMLSKVDEAAYPWPMIKGLSEQPLPVSCMATNSRIMVLPEVFDSARLAHLALLSLSEHMPQGVALTVAPPLTPAKALRRSRDAQSQAGTQRKPAAVKPTKVSKNTKTNKVIDADATAVDTAGSDVSVVPGFSASNPALGANTFSGLKVVHG